MKTTVALLILLVLLGLHSVLSRGAPAATAQPGARQEVAAPARADLKNDPGFANKIVDVFKDCQKIKPGMTRAELVKLEMFDEDSAPLHDVNDKSFKPHTTFYYRSCALIKVDVDFRATEAKEARPGDVITKVSMPFIDARARR